nr:hypothetical protein [Tobacco rattle virus]
MVIVTKGAYVHEFPRTAEWNAFAQILSREHGYIVSDTALEGAAKPYYVVNSSGFYGPPGLDGLISTLDRELQYYSKLLYEIKGLGVMSDENVFGTQYDGNLTARVSRLERRLNPMSNIGSSSRPWSEHKSAVKKADLERYVYANFADWSNHLGPAGKSTREVVKYLMYRMGYYSDTSGIGHDLNYKHFRDHLDIYNLTCSPPFLVSNAVVDGHYARDKFVSFQGVCGFNPMFPDVNGLKSSWSLGRQLDDIRSQKKEVSGTNQEPNYYYDGDTLKPIGSGASVVGERRPGWR